MHNDNYLFAVRNYVPMTAKGSSMPSMSVAGSTPSLKLLCWLGLDRKCVSRTRPSFKVEG